jgi:hypothetical protein
LTAFVNPPSQINSRVSDIAATPSRKEPYNFGGVGVAFRVVSDPGPDVQHKKIFLNGNN